MHLTATPNLSSVSKLSSIPTLSDSPRQELSKTLRQIRLINKERLRLAIQLRVFIAAWISVVVPKKRQKPIVHTGTIRRLYVKN